jgi:hypothetical protein
MPHALSDLAPEMCVINFYPLATHIAIQKNLGCISHKLRRLPEMKWTVMVELKHVLTTNSIHKYNFIRMSNLILRKLIT